MLIHVVRLCSDSLAFSPIVEDFAAGKGERNGDQLFLAFCVRTDTLIVFMFGVGPRRGLALGLELKMRWF